MEEFLSKPKTHHVRSLLILLGCVIVMIAIGGAFAYFWQKDSVEEDILRISPEQMIPLTSLGSTTSQVLTRKIIERISLPTPLTSGERTVITQQFGGVGSKVWASLTPAERKAVVEALNK